MSDYLVLWLDDDFLPLIKNPSEDQEDINDIRETFQDDVHQAGKYGLKVDGVTDFKQFKKKLKDADKYQAVICDLMGLDNENIDNYYVIQDVLDEIRDTSLIAYIYSNNISSDKFDLTLKKFKDQGRCFDKGKGCKPLFSKIQEELDDKLALYKPYPELFAIISKAYLPSADKQRLDKLLEDYKNQNTSPSEKGYIRDLFQSMMESLVYYDGKKDGKKLIDDLLISPKLGRFGDLFKALSYGKLPGRDRTGGHPNSFQSPLVPVSICPAPVKNAIQYVGNLANLLDHGKDQSEEVFEKPYYSTMMLGIYPTLIEILKWYYFYMES